LGQKQRWVREVCCITEGTAEAFFSFPRQVKKRMNRWCSEEHDGNQGEVAVEEDVHKMLFAARHSAVLVRHQPRRGASAAISK